MNGNFRENHRSGFRQRFYAPIKEGEEIDVKVVALGEKGDGIAKVKGFIIIVPEAKEGDELRIKVTRVLKKAAFGEIVGDAQGPCLPTEREDFEKPKKEDSEEELEEDSEEELEEEEEKEE